MSASYLFAKYRAFGWTVVTASFLCVGLVLTSTLSVLSLAVCVAIGLFIIVRDAIPRIRERRLSLDYIAFLAMVLSPAIGQFVAGAVIACMYVGGKALELYANDQAESALKALVDRIPKECVIIGADGTQHATPIQDVREGEVIRVRMHELVPLDGTLVSDRAVLNESNLTGEALPVTYKKDEPIKSGTVNAGATIDIAVTGSLETSTYMHIVSLVKSAHAHQPPIVRLAERVNFPFTVATLLLAAIAYLVSGEMTRVLAVLVIATPCPLIIAAPVAYIGGLSRAARHNIIIKRPATLEVLDRVSTIFFDKTGTLTLGEPTLIRIENSDPRATDAEYLAIAASIEVHSLHPLARALVTSHKARSTSFYRADAVEETLGRGITGIVQGETYTVTQTPGAHADGISLSLLRGSEECARFVFQDHIKDNVDVLFRFFADRLISASLLTGDKQENANRLFARHHIPIIAETTPLQKFATIENAKKNAYVVAMVGDGLNDAPALAHADVGIVFSGSENSASIEAGHVAILGHDVLLVRELFVIARRTARIARESIYIGVGLSLIGMVVALFGYLPPTTGAILQETIDTLVILNALRTVW